jgi:hypothetical protein
VLIFSLLFIFGYCNYFIIFTTYIFYILFDIRACGVEVDCWKLTANCSKAKLRKSGDKTPCFSQFETGSAWDKSLQISISP